jgi:hypothetical protein
MKHQLFTIALLGLFALPLSAQAESSLPNQSSEWAGIRQIMNIMGKGTLSPADQNAMLEILNAKEGIEKNAADMSKPTAPSSFPATPIKPVPARKLPPHRSPSTF